MLERIIQEKTSADHLLYVSLKYTKTCDVVLNLIDRWKSLMEACFDALIQKAKKRKLVKSVPSAPKVKIEKLKEAFSKEEIIINAITLYEFFKRTENSQKLRENDFRKNVTLKIMDKGRFVDVNLDKLKEYAEILERFISRVRQFLLS